MSIENIMLVEYVEEIGPYKKDKVMHYNEKHITEEEAMRCLRAGEYNENIILITKNQWVSLFNSGKVNRTRVIDLLNKYNGIWYVYEPVVDGRDRTIGQKRIVTYRSSQRDKDKILHRSVHDFAVSNDGGINIYLNQNKGERE